MSARLFKPGLVSAAEVYFSRQTAGECRELISEHPEMEPIDRNNLEQAALFLTENAQFCTECALRGITILAPKSFGKEFAS